MFFFFNFFRDEFSFLCTTGCKYLSVITTIAGRICVCMYVSMYVWMYVCNVM